jgi:hypothetical protein
MVQYVKEKTIALSDWALGTPMVILACALSVIAWFATYMNGLTMTYNDAMSHINIARLVIDNQEPGFSQIGSVWLPLNHVLPVILIWNDTLWRTGLAGSIFSMASFIISVVAIYKIVALLTKNRVAAFIGGLVFAANLNMLYLQSTPLTEPLYVALFSVTALFFLKYIAHNNAKLLPVLGFMGFLQVLTRYDGWFVMGIVGMLILFNELVLKGESIRESIGKVLLYGLPVGFSMLLWLLWNQLIFGDSLYFATGEYSAQAQQNTIEQATELITKGNIFTSTLAYGFVMLHNVGSYVLAAALAGVAAFFIFTKHYLLHDVKKLLFLLLLLSPILFNIIALFLGFSIINVPELNWNPSGNSVNQWFNVRYGILALPSAAILFGVFASWRKLAVIVALMILLLQTYLTYTTGVITITDGTVGSSAFRQHTAAHKLSELVGPKDTVLMSFSSFSPLAFKSNLELQQFIHEGVSQKWQKALKNPSSYATHIVMSSKKDGETVRRDLLLENGDDFLKRYELVYEDDEAALYRLRTKGLTIAE